MKFYALVFSCLIATPAFAGGDIPRTNPNCRINKNVIESKTVALRSGAGQIQMDLIESTASGCGGSTHSLYVLIQALDQSVTESIDYTLFASESHGNPYILDGNFKARQIGGSGKLLNFCNLPSGPLVVCSNVFIAIEGSTLDRFTPVAPIATNSYNITIVGDAIPRTEFHLPARN